MKTYKIKVTFEDKSQISQEIKAFDSREAVLLLLSRSFVGQRVEGGNNKGLEIQWIDAILLEE